jgi:hypothetical protein
MIQDIKFSIIIVLFFFSCKENKATPIETNIFKNKNIESTNIFFSDYVFYKAFADCNSDVGYFTNEEAQKIYAEKEISIDIKQAIKESKKDIFSDKKLKCLENNLDIKIYNEVLRFNTKQTFPFDSLLLINNEYIIVSRDAYYFIFKRKDVQSDKKANEISHQQKNFETLLNKNIIGLSIINAKEQSLYKKYGIDFSTSCVCDSPSLYIDTKLNELIIFNYCDASNTPAKEIEHKHVYNILKITNENQLTITTEKNLTIIFNKLKDLPLYEITIKGDFPTKFTGSNLKKIYTTESEKYVEEDCGDYEG